MSDCNCNKNTNEDLRKWFGKGGAGGTTAGGWDRYGSDGQKLGKCGDAKAGEPYSACLSAEKARKLGKKGIANFVKRKRAAQKKAGDAKKGGEQKKGQKPTYVKTGASESVVEEFGAPIGYLPSPSRKSVNKMKKSGNTSGKYGNYKLAERFELFLEKNVPTDPTKWSYYKSQAKKKFDVYPSAYANAWAAKKYKAAGGKWKTEEAKLEKEKFTKPDQMRVNELVFTNTTRLDGYEVAKFV